MEFTILGRTQLFIAGDRVDLGLAKPRALLTILLLNVGRPVLAGTIAQQLWNGRPVEQVRGPLHSAVSRVRTSLRRAGVPHHLRTEPGSYRLDLEPTLVDYHRFRRQVVRANVARDRRDHLLAQALLHEAIDMWRGVPLADLRTEWAAERRTQMIRDDLLPAQQALISTLLELGQYAEALAQLGGMIDENPTDDVLAMQRMIALDQMGRFAEATNFYVRFRRLVLKEYGAEPGPIVQAAHARILARRGTGMAAPQTSHNGGATSSYLPRCATNFTGRQDLLGTLDECFASRTDAQYPPVVALHGMPGVGKTSLAVYWATTREDRFPGGRFYLDVNAYGPGEPMSTDDATTALLSRLGIGAEHIPADPGERRAALEEELRRRPRTLLLIDNVGDSENSRPLLRMAGTACSVLLTSRGRLTGLAIRDGVTAVDVPPMSMAEAVALLRRELGPQRSDAEPDATARLAGLSGGLPLALKIIGNRSASRGDVDLAELARELDGLLVRLTDSDDEAATLSGVFSWSYGGLSRGAARLFRLLGLHPGDGFGDAVACALAGGPAAREHVDELVQGHLVEPVGRQLYRIHALLHEYAADRAEAEEAPGQRLAAVVRLCDFYLATATALRRTLAPEVLSVPAMPTSTGVIPVAFSGHEDAHRWLNQERANLMAVTHVAARNHLHGHAWRIPATISVVLERGGFKDDFLAALIEGLRSASLMEDRAAEAGMVLNIGRFHFGRRDYVTALNHFRRAVTMATAAGSTELRIIGQHNLASAHLELGQLGLAIQTHQETVRMFRRMGFPHGQAYGLSRIAHAYRRLGRHDKALAHFEAALSIRTETDDVRGQGDTLTDLGSLHLEWGKHDSARDYCLRALECHERSRDEVKAAETLTILAAVEHAVCNFEDAALYAARAVHLGENTQSTHHQARALVVLGRTLHAVGDPGGAGTAWRRALSIPEGLTGPDHEEARSLLTSLG